MIALTLLLGCLLLGFAAGGRGAARSGALLALGRGVVLAHVWLSVLSLSGVRWTRPLVLLPFAASAAALAYRYFPRRRDSRVTQRLAVPIAAPDIVAGLLLLGVAALALAERITLADFFYHWGQKGEKYALHGGIDFAFLARSWNWPVHPAYPPALSELYGATALVRGAWVSAEQMLWGVGFVAFAWVGYRTLLVERLGAARGRWAALSVCAALCAATVRYRLVGGADLLLALAVALATQALARQPDPIGRAARWPPRSRSAPRPRVWPSPGSCWRCSLRRPASAGRGCAPRFRGS